MTQKEAKAKLRERGMTLSRVEGEYRVNFARGAESTAYYTTDILDAVDTGRHMAHHARITGQQTR